MLIVYFSICWLIDIALASWMTWDAAIWAGIATAVLLCGLILRCRSQAGWVLFGLSILCLGGVRYAIAVPVIDESQVAYYNDTGATVGIIGTILKEPDPHDTYVNLKVTAARIAFPDGTSQPVEGNVLVQAPRFPVIDYGTEVAANGRLETPVLATLLIRHNYGGLLIRFSVLGVNKQPFPISQPASAIQERTIVRLN